MFFHVDCSVVHSSATGDKSRDDKFVPCSHLHLRTARASWHVSRSRASRTPSKFQVIILKFHLRLRRVGRVAYFRALLRLLSAAPSLFIKHFSGLPRSKKIKLATVWTAIAIIVCAYQLHRSHGNVIAPKTSVRCLILIRRNADSICNCVQIVFTDGTECPPSRFNYPMRSRPTILTHILPISALHARLTIDSALDRRVTRHAWPYDRPN